MRIMHVFRAPVGGLFRHVRDLIRAQAMAGHDVGLICDSATGGDQASIGLAETETWCNLGIHRIAMSRMPGLGDAISARRVAEHCRSMDLDILHGHGAKGGAYARLTANRIGAKAIYTPHGGSLHFDWSNAKGAIFLGLERYMLARTAGVCFVCDYERRTFANKIGLGNVPSRVVHNGLKPEDFNEVPLDDGATDVLFIGELRGLKGVDVLIEAIHLINEKRRTTATIVGDGVARDSLEEQVASLGLEGHISFAGAMPARTALALGNVLVVPSRAESFPYVVLEAAAADRIVVASDVGGIGEIVDADCLVPADDPARLASRLGQVFSKSDTYSAGVKARKVRLTREFTVERMGSEICSFYQEILNSQAPGAIAA